MAEYHNFDNGLFVVYLWYFTEMGVDLGLVTIVYRLTAFWHGFSWQAIKAAININLFLPRFPIYLLYHLIDKRDVFAHTLRTLLHVL